MKIFCMISSLQLGGAERQLLGLASTLQKAGHEVCVLTYRRNDFYKDTLAAQGLKSIVFEKKTNVVSWALSLGRYLKDQGCELLIAFLPGACLKALLVHRLNPCFRLVLSERNFSRRLGVLERFRLWAARVEADKVICNNYAQEELIRRQIPALSAKLGTIPNFVDVDYFSPAADGSVSTDGRVPVDGAPVSDGACRQILVTARVCRRKNTLGLIRAAALLKEKGLRFRIDWWGVTRENAYYNKCMALIGRLDLRDEFHLHPATVEVRELYRKADIFCLPSFYEGTSNSIAEAMACGKPVACSRVSDNPRYVKEGENGFLFDPSDVSSMAEALERALTVDEAVLARMGQVSRETAFTQLHPDQFARAYQELIDSLR